MHLCHLSSLPHINRMVIDHAVNVWYCYKNLMCLPQQQKDILLEKQFSFQILQ